MELKSKVLQGLKWSMLEKLVMQLFSWASTFYVIRILTPADYGLVALSTVVFAFVNLIAVNGFTSVLIKKQDKNFSVASQVFTISLVINIVMACLVVLLAPTISNFYQAPDLKYILYTLAAVVPFNSFVIVPDAYLGIDMNYKSRAVATTIATLVSIVVAITLASLKFGYWALVASAVANNVIRIFLLNLVSKAKYGLTARFMGSKELLKFVFSLQTNSVLWLLYNRLDSIIIGKYFGVSQLGIYNVAVEVASLPMTKVSTVLNQVGLAAFSSLKEDRSATSYYLGKSLKIMALITFPIFLGVSCVADELVRIVLGEKWIESAAIISIFCFVFPFRMMNLLIQNYVNAMNRPNFNLMSTSITSVILVILIFIGVQYGLKETALAWVLGFLFCFIINLIRLKSTFQLRLYVVLSWFPPMLPALIMWVLVFFGLPYCIQFDSVLLLLIVKISVGVGFVATVYMLFYRHELFNLLRRKVT